MGVKHPDTFLHLCEPHGGSAVQAWGPRPGPSCGVALGLMGGSQDPRPGPWPQCAASSGAGPSQVPWGLIRYPRRPSCVPAMPHPAPGWLTQALWTVELGPGGGSVTPGQFQRPPKCLQHFPVPSRSSWRLGTCAALSGLSVIVVSREHPTGSRRKSGRDWSGQRKVLPTPGTLRKAARRV